MQIRENTKLDAVSQQQSRVYRVAILATGLAIYLVACWTILSIGSVDIAPVQFGAFASLACAGFLAFWIAILFDWNLGLRDPDMNLAQMMWAVSVVLMTAYFVVEMKPVVVLSGLAMIVVGANRLSRTELLVFVLYSITLYMLSVLDKVQPATEFIAMIAFGLVLVFGPVLYRLEMLMVERLLIDRNEELSDALDQIRDLAVKDDLTGAYNRRHLMVVLSQHKAMADRRNNYRFTLCAVDLDFFDQVNSSFVHETGDQDLTRFAQIAESVLREVDCISRVRGTEFILVLGGTTENDALIVAHRIGEGLVESQVSDTEAHTGLTASIGLTEYRRGEEVERTMDRADRALYDAKRTGRNQVVVARYESAAGASG
ncbi:MAG: GGDEF domain-containing protein [bacterium]